MALKRSSSSTYCRNSRESSAFPKDARYSDTKSGMQQQLSSLANLSLLGNFVGMLTDSRSFLSYTRHEYFRRILCLFVGELVENGEYPNDEKALKKLIEDICFNNALNYFNLK